VLPRIALFVAGGRQVGMVMMKGRFWEEEEIAGGRRNE
jgi:hypothetical protein